MEVGRGVTVKRRVAVRGTAGVDAEGDVVAITCSGVIEASAGRQPVNITIKTKIIGRRKIIQIVKTLLSCHPLHWIATRTPRMICASRPGNGQRLPDKEAVRIGQLVRLNKRLNRDPKFLGNAP